VQKYNHFPNYQIFFQKKILSPKEQNGCQLFKIEKKFQKSLPDAEKIQFLSSKKAKIGYKIFKTHKNVYIYLNYNKLSPIFA